MAEIASLNAHAWTSDGGQYTAIWALHDDGTVTRQYTSVDGMTVTTEPTVYRRLTEAEQRVNCADPLSAADYLAHLLDAKGWTVAR